MSEIVYGRNPVEELLKNQSRRIDEVVYSESANKEDLNSILQDAYERGIPVESHPKSRLDEMTDDQRHQGILAVAASSGLVSFKELMAELPETGSRRLLIVDRVQDPVNLGKLIRSALFFGVNGVIKSDRETTPVSDTVVKTSAGAATRLPIAEVSNLNQTLDELKDRHFWLVGTDVHADQTPGDVPVDRDLGFMVGNEQDGLSRLSQENCDYLVRIPGTGGFDSLNVAMAGTILMYDCQPEYVDDSIG